MQSIGIYLILQIKIITSISFLCIGVQMPKVTIDEDTCIGCGICVEKCPAVFELVGDKARVKNENACKECDCQDAADSCPVAAIKYTP